MQYIYTQEEHDRIATDKAAFDMRVENKVREELRLARLRVNQVIEQFFKTFQHDITSRFGAHIDYQMLKGFADKLHEANSLPKAKESCDKDTGCVIQ